MVAAYDAEVDSGAALKGFTTEGVAELFEGCWRPSPQLRGNGLSAGACAAPLDRVPSGAEDSIVAIAGAFDGSV